MQTDFLYYKILEYLPAKRKRTPSGSFNFDCPMCLQMGHTRPDTKQRCGITSDATGSIRVHCFNCSFVTGWTPGRMIGSKLRSFMGALGMPDTDIKQANFTTWQLSHLIESVPERVRYTFNPDFPEVDLPDGALPISVWALNDCNDKDFLETIQYAMTRGDDIFDNNEFYWSPSKKYGLNRRLIIPFFWEEKIVGWTGRAIDTNRQPRYYTETPSHFLFNNINLYRDRKYAILVEGIFDALSVEAVATQGAKLSEEQADWIKGCGKTIIVLPDKDKDGQLMIDLAVKHDYHVSFPNWDDDLKDANDAILRYGKLWTIKTIIDSATDNKLKINLLRKKWQSKK